MLFYSYPSQFRQCNGTALNTDIIVNTIGCIGFSIISFALEFREANAFIPKEVFIGCFKVKLRIHKVVNFFQPFEFRFIFCRCYSQGLFCRFVVLYFFTKHFMIHKADTTKYFGNQLLPSSDRSFDSKNIPSTLFCVFRETPSLTISCLPFLKFHHQSLALLRYLTTITRW